MVEDYSRACQRERGKEKEIRRKKPRKKPLRRDRDLNPRTLSPEPSVLSTRPRRPAQAINLDIVAKVIKLTILGRALVLKRELLKLYWG